MPKTERAPSGKKYHPHFAITFGSFNYELALELQKMLGGYLRHIQEPSHAYVLTLSSIKDLSRVASLINGHLRTCKIEHFNDLLT